MSRMMKTLISGLLANGMLLGSSTSKAAIKKIKKVGFGDPSIELLLHHLVELDEFEEKNYQLLMEYYSFHHQLGKFFETYYKLVDLLDRELSVRPSRAIEELYHPFWKPNELIN